MTNRAIKKLVDAVKQAVENSDTNSIKAILRRGSHTDYIFPSVIEGRVRLSARNLFLRVNATMPEPLSEPEVFCLNYKDTLGNVLLHLAAMISDYELTRLLLEKGADVTSIDKLGRTPLHTACEEKSLDIIKILVENSPTCILYRRDDEGCTPLDKACQYSCPEAVHFLLPQVNIVFIEEFGPIGTILYAVENCAEYAAPIASLLLDAGANINSASFLKRTALMYAVKKSALEVRHATSSTANPIYPFRDLCMLLIDRGCDINAADLYGQTALHFSAMEKQESLVRKLLISGSDIDRRDLYGFTPMYYACKNGTQRIVELFIIAGAKLQNKDWKNILTDLTEDSGKDFHLLNYVMYQSKQCLSLQNLCNISIRKNLRNVEEDSIQLGLPPLLVKRLQFRD